MEIALGVAIGLVAALAAILAFILRRRSRPQGRLEDAGVLMDYLRDLAGVRARVDSMAVGQEGLRTGLTSLESGLRGLEAKLIESTGSVKDSVLRDFAEARRTLEVIRAELEARKQLERDLQESSRRIEAVIAGGRSRGRAGENILAEAFKQFPPHIVETNFKVNGHPVEYALVLVDGRRVPVDSKWAAAELIDGLEREADAAARERIIGQIEQAVLAKVREVRKYIDPSSTTPWGVAAIPDAAFAVCRNTHLQAFSDRVMLMPFSLAVVYLLSLYQLHLEYCRSVDMDKLEGYVDQIDKGMDKIGAELDNKVSRGTAMIANAFDECKRQLGAMRGATSYLRSLPANTGPTAALDVGSPEPESDEVRSTEAPGNI